MFSGCFALISVVTQNRIGPTSCKSITMNAQRNEKRERRKNNGTDEGGMWARAISAHSIGVARNLFWLLDSKNINLRSGGQKLKGRFGLNKRETQDGPSLQKYKNFIVLSDWVHWIQKCELEKSNHTFL